jgi:hypothetical protein
VKHGLRQIQESKSVEILVVDQPHPLFDERHRSPFVCGIETRVVISQWVMTLLIGMMCSGQVAKTMLTRTNTATPPQSHIYCALDTFETGYVEVHPGRRHPGRTFNIRASHRVLAAVTTNDPFAGSLIEPNNDTRWHASIVCGSLAGR